MNEALPDYNTLSKMTAEELNEIFGVRDFFVYEIDFPALAAAGGTANGSFTVQADSNFLWEDACFFADVAAAAQTNDTRVLPLVTCSIQDGGSGRKLMAAQVPIPSIFGYGSEPYHLPTPRFFRAQTQVIIDVTNFSAATIYNLRLSFIGTKFFKFGS